MLKQGLDRSAALKTASKRSHLVVLEAYGSGRTGKEPEGGGNVKYF